jgi:hypothetical protein
MRRGLWSFPMGTCWRPGIAGRGSGRRMMWLFMGLGGGAGSGDLRPTRALLDEPAVAPRERALLDEPAVAPYAVNPF